MKPELITWLRDSPAREAFDWRLAEARVIAASEELHSALRSQRVALKRAKAAYAAVGSPGRGPGAGAVAKAEARP